MSGKGRTRKKSPDTKETKRTKPEEVKQASLPKCRGKDFTEQRQNGTAKEEKLKEQKKTNHTKEQLSVHDTRKEKPVKHFTEETNRQQQIPAEKTKAAGINAKTCAGRTKETDQSSEKTKKTQPETQKDSIKAIRCGGKTKMMPETSKDNTKDCLQTTKAKACGGKEKPTVRSVEEKTQMQLQTTRATTDGSVQITKPKTCPPCKIKSPENFEDVTPKGTTKALVPQDRCKDKAAVDSLLHTTLQQLKIRAKERSEAAEVVNSLIKNIVKHLKKKSTYFLEVEEPLRTGSYYENLKISNPDEFDVMLPMPVDRVHIEPFSDDGAFYSVGLKRGNSPLKEFQKDDILSANKMLQEFRKEVTLCVKEFKEWELTRKKPGCPAVTLTTKVQSTTISLDVVLSLMVKSSWPTFTNDGLRIEGWLGAKVKQDYKRKPYYLVPKYEGKAKEERDGVLAQDIWRVSFSHVEKAIMKNHGSEKTCCEKNGARCCRKDCLKLLKHLLSLLKTKDASFDKFCSYHAKTTLLHACSTRTKDSDWSQSDLGHCFQLLLTDFIAHLKSGKLYNFFIPTQNLLARPSQAKCNSLASRIKEEIENGFPIFKQ